MQRCSRRCLCLAPCLSLRAAVRPRAVPASYPALDGRKTTQSLKRPSAVPQARTTRYGAFGDEIRSTMDRFPEAIVLTQVGKFYESYFEQASKVAESCRITLTSKDWRMHDTDLIERSPFCGFPKGGLTKHLRTLVDAFGAVVIVDEVAFNDDGTKQRAITRIVTPATLLEDGLFDASVPNYLMAITSSSLEELTIAWTDPSTGDFFEQESSAEDLRDVIARVSPVEIVLRSDEAEAERIKAAITPFNIRLSTLKVDAERPMSSATELAVAYLGTNMPLADAGWVSDVETLSGSSLMRIDASAFAALEIRASSHRSSSYLGSLIHAVKRTVTPGGSRLLLQRLSAPSTDLAEIRRRHDLVEALTQIGSAQIALGQILQKCGDHARVVQQARRQRGQPSLLVALRDLLQGITDLKELLSSRPHASLQELSQMLTPLPRLAERLEQIIRPDANFAGDEEAEESEDVEGPTSEEISTASAANGSASKAPLFSSWSFAVQESASPALTEAHDTLSRLQEEAVALQNNLRQESGSARIHLSISARGEPFVRSQGRAELQGQRLIRTLKGGKHYEVQAWTSLYRSLVNQRSLILELEAEVLGQLQNAVRPLISFWTCLDTKKILSEAVTLRKNGQVIDELDVGRSFATLASERRYVRPEMTDDDSLDIAEGVHPVVSDALSSQGQHFTPNSLTLGGNEPRVSIVTGPNMGGKSTFLRQAALFVILAQAGGFVPAKSARVGICDAIFTRVGASDDLFRGQSTFMLEMSETAHILRGVTLKSLVIMDEIGRGTAPHEGIAIAYAVADALIASNGARTLFATHFHRVIDLLEREGPARVSLLCTEIQQESDGSLTFSHRVRRGQSREAGALLVAKHAGVPSAVLDKASHVLALLNAERSG